MENIFALDLGTTKFCIAGLFFSRGQEPRIDFVSASAKGMHRGMLCDFQEAALGIQEVLHLAEEKFSSQIRQVSVGVAGSHLRSMILKGKTHTGHGPITTTTLESLGSIAKRNYQDQNRELIHFSPLTYDLDERGPVINPLNLSAHSITGKYFAIDADRLYLRDIIHAVNEAGLEVAHLFAEPYASSEVTLTPEARNLGIAVADIGGGTTDGMIYFDGKPTACFTFNIGGIMMTRDIAIGLNLPFIEAEKAKNFFGLSGQKTMASIDLKSVDDQIITVNGQQVQHILGHRVLEWTEILAKKLAPFRGQLGAGLLLTGGGSQILSLDQVIKHQFKIPVRTIGPSMQQINCGNQLSGKFATVLGLLELTIQRQQRLKSHPGKSWSMPIVRHLTSWFKELST
jgi:cell division protein FtsA